MGQDISYDLLISIKGGNEILMNRITHIKSETLNFSNWGYIKLDIFEIDSSDIKLVNTKLDYYFEFLKMTGFNNSVKDFEIDYESSSEIEYGNYNLKRITLKNFRKLDFSDSIESIKNYIYFIDELITGSLNAAPLYFKYFNESFLPHLSDCKVGLELIDEVRGKTELMLSWGGRYEHFKSFIFFCPNSKTVKHLEMGRD